MKRIAYIVQSGDKGQWLWKYWSYFYRKWWKENDLMEIVFIGETIAPTTIPGIKTAISCAGPWGKTVRDAISSLIDSKYVMLCHEDYLFDGPVDLERLGQIADIMDTNNLQLVKCCGWWSGHINEQFPMIESDIALPNGEKLWRYNNGSMYLISHQMSVWNKDFLLSTIKDNDTPWHHELDGTDRLRERNVPIYSYRGACPVPYAEISTAGKIREGAQRWVDEVENAERGSV